MNVSLNVMLFILKSIYANLLSCVFISTFHVIIMKPVCGYSYLKSHTIAGRQLRDV
jgi:hypothetical protein